MNYDGCFIMSSTWLMKVERHSLA